MVVLFRKMIVCGCVSFAKHVGSVRLEAELLPQCWEQITYKYHERPLLVAECCGALAPYIPVSECDINCGFFVSLLLGHFCTCL